MAFFKLPLFFLTLFCVFFNVNTHGKVLNNNNTISKLHTSSIAHKTSFVGLKPKTLLESNQTTTLCEVKSHKNLLYSKLLNERNKKLVLVTGGTLVFAVTVYKFVSRVVRYFLYDKYATSYSPGVVNTLGHVLLKNTKYSPNGLFTSKVLNPLSKAFENVSFFKGLLRPGMKRVSTSSLIDKDTYVLLYFNYTYKSPQLKKFSDNILDSLKSGYESLKKSGKKIEVVSVDLSKSNDQCYENFKRSPWYSLPFEDFKRKEWLLKKFEVFSTPRAVLLDSEGNVVQDRCLNMLFSNVNNFPWDHLTFQDLLPDLLFNYDNNLVCKSKLEGKLVGLLYDGGNMEVRSKLKKKVAEFYEYMNKLSNGNFEVVVMNVDSETKDMEESHKSTHPNWFTVRLYDHTCGNDHQEVDRLFDRYSVNLMNRFVLLDQEGNVFANNFHHFLDERLYDDLYEEYSKGANKVKGDKLTYLHMFNSPTLMVFADNEDPKTLEKIEEDMNKVFAKHRHKRKTSLVEFILIKNKELADLIKKGLKLKKEKMVLISKAFKPILYDGEVNEKSLLEMLERFYKANN